MARNERKKQSWLDLPALGQITINWEIVLFAVIMLLAVLSRFYDLGLRVMSHDETSHVYFSWQLFQGQGYAHSALTHGPLQFHLIAFFYFLFGDSDFSARIPMALFSIATVGFVWNFRRYIGRIGALIAAGMFLISPYMLYYGRYARNEAFVGLFGLVTIWAILRYLDLGENKYLYFLTAATALHFASKETSFIYTAQALIFLGFLFLMRMNKHKWTFPKFQKLFLTSMYATAFLFIAAFAIYAISGGGEAIAISATEVVEPVVAGEATGAVEGSSIPPAALAIGGAGILALISALQFLVRGYTWPKLREERSFSLMLLLGTLVLPHLAAFPITWLGGNPLDYSDPDNLILISIVVAVLGLLSAIIGLLWKPKIWLINMAIFFAIFIPLFTTIFTNTNGFFSGLVGSLGYWLEQQGVQRGNQPSYYYWGVQIPIYEYLAGLGIIMAGWMGFNKFRKNRKSDKPEGIKENGDLRQSESRKIALVMLAFWAVTSLIAYTVAGEKMPWLTYHIAIPMILLSGWAFGRLFHQIDTEKFRNKNGLLASMAFLVFVFALFGILASLLGTNSPFQGPESVQLRYTNQFIFQIIVLIGSAVWLRRLLQGWEWKQIRAGMGLILILSLAFITARSSYMASFIEYDNATEYLVYAHMARGPKEILERIEELSERIEDGNTMVVAYDNETTYPFWWYLRNFPNQRYYAESPGRDLLEAPVILVGDTNYGKIEPIVQNNYYEYEYIRIWWPNQDYFDFSYSSLGFEFTADTGQPSEEMGQLEYIRRAFIRIWDIVKEPAMRTAIFDIWMNRDYDAYFQAKNQTIDMTNWNPSRTMRMYVRKDIVAQIWDFGVEPLPDAIVADPYENGGIELAADFTVGAQGSEAGNFISPRGLGIAPNGDVYVADSNNHRIQQFSPEGEFIRSWGEFANRDQGNAPGGSFNEPWGVAVSPDGEFVFVADTWNHRVQKFTAEGEFIREWGVFGQGEDAYAMWGPRDLIVDNNGNVLVVDTGNKRVKIFDGDGNFISQFGNFGFDLGNFDEPVGIALDRESNQLYVADTWNQRVQVFEYNGGFPIALAAWDINGWYGQSLENKPYLSVGVNGRVYISDPEAGRILVYESDGTFVDYWGGFDQSAVMIGIAQGVVADDANHVWVSDSQNNQLLHFTREELAIVEDSPDEEISAQYEKEIIFANEVVDDWPEIRVPDQNSYIGLEDDLMVFNMEAGESLFGTYGKTFGNSIFKIDFQWLEIKDLPNDSWFGIEIVSQEELDEEPSNDFSFLINFAGDSQFIVDGETFISNDLEPLSLNQIFGMEVQCVANEIIGVFQGAHVFSIEYSCSSQNHELRISLSNRAKVGVEKIFISGMLVE